MRTSIHCLLRRTLGPRGATTVEYGLLLIGVILFAAGGFKLLGSKLKGSTNRAGDQVAGQGAGGGGGGGAGAESPSQQGGGKAGGGGGGGDGKMTAASKVEVGGVGGAGAGAHGGGGGNGSGAGSERTTESGGQANGPVASTEGGSADVSEGFGAKRWFGIGLLAAGVLAIGYVVMGMRRSKKAADAAGPSKGAKPV